MKPNNGMTDIGIRQKLNDRFGSLADVLAKFS